MLGKKLVALALCAAAPLVGAQQWTSVGPKGGWIGYLLADPSVPGRVYATGYGFYVSTDAGRTWTSAGTGLHADDRVGIGLSADPDRPGRLYFVDTVGRLLRSDDYAASWTATGYLLPLAAAPFGRGRVPMADVPGSADALLLAPGDGYVYKSTNSGATFTPLAYLGSNGRVVESLAVDPSNPQLVFAGMGPGSSGSINGPTLLRSDSGGLGWLGVIGVPHVGSGSSIAFVPGGPLVAALNGRVYVSGSAGQSGSWTATDVPARLLAVAPTAQHEVVAMSSAGCAKSVDFTVSAQSCDTGLPGASAYSGFGDVVAVADGASGYRALANDSTIGVRAMNPTSASWSTSNSGINSRNLRGLAIVPGHPERLIVGYWSSSDLTENAPMFSTTDGGVQWRTQFVGQMRYVRALAADPTTASMPGQMHVYAGGLYAVQNWQPQSSGVFRSVDGGETWTSIGAGFPSANPPILGNIGLIRRIVLDPRSCAQPPAAGPCRQGPLDTVFAIGSREGWRVARGSQRGDNWVSGDNGLPLSFETAVAEEAVFPIDLDFDAANGDVYVVTFSLVDTFDGSPGVNTITNGVFRSTDGGIHWEHRSNGIPLMSGSTQTNRDVWAVATHPRRAGVAWVSTVEPGGFSRIYKTTDRGANWFASGPELTGCDVREIQVDLAAPDVVYAAGNGVGFASACLYRSEDGGASWQSVAANAPAGNLYDLRWDERDQARLIMTTENGVWELRAPSDKIFIGRFDD